MSTTVPDSFLMVSVDKHARNLQNSPFSPHNAKNSVGQWPLSPFLPLFVVHTHGHDPQTPYSARFELDSSSGGGGRRCWRMYWLIHRSSRVRQLSKITRSKAFLGMSKMPFWPFPLTIIWGTMTFLVDFLYSFGGVRRNRCFGNVIYNSKCRLRH